MIGFIGAAITVTLNYNHLQQLTIADCPRLVQFHSWTTSVFFVTINNEYYVFTLYCNYARNKSLSLINTMKTYGGLQVWFHCSSPRHWMEVSG
jgi:hypothetical protein